MSKMSPKSAYPFFPCASLPIVPNIHLAKWPLPFTHAETGYLPLLTLLPLGYTGVLGWADHGLIRVLSSLLSFLLSSVSNILGLPSPSCPCLFPGDPLLLRHSQSPIHVFSHSLPHFHRKAPPTEVLLLSISHPNRLLSRVCCCILRA